MSTIWRWLDDDPDTAIIEAARALNQDASIIFPTDTVYGLLAACTSPLAYRRTYALKHRPPDQPLALLASIQHPAVQAVPALISNWPAALEEFLHGTLTLVVSPEALPAHSLSPQLQRLQPGPIGLRRPSCPHVQALLGHLGGLAWATSVNRTGGPPAATSQEVKDWLTGLSGDAPALVVARRVPLAGRPSSLATLAAGRLNRRDR